MLTDSVPTHTPPFCLCQANASRGTDTPYRHMTQSWVLSLFFDCENGGMLSWAGSGWPAAGLPVLHCPNATTIAEVRGALKRGDIFMHAFPHNGEASTYPDVSLFNAALDMASTLSAELGIKPPTAVSQRDVPGWTRAAIPLLSKRGINGLSFGAGTSALHAGRSREERQRRGGEGRDGGASREPLHGDRLTRAAPW